MSTRHAFRLALLLSGAALVVWVVTGAHAYTKYEVVRSVTKPVEEDDPLAGTGFYEDETVTTTERIPEFHFGLLPTPEGVFDRHLFALTPVLGVVWGVTGVLWWRRRRH